MKRVEIERQAIVKALDRAPNITQAARDLHASRRTLQSRMRDYNLPPGEAGRPRQLLPKGLSGALSLTGGLVLGGVIGALAMAVWWLRRRPVGGAAVVVGAATQVGTAKVRLRGLDLLGVR